MSKLLEGLNPSQREAVTHKTGPLLIIAGPGSGKTRTVVHSIAYAIEENRVMPEQILVFSFTRKAREELKHRVQEIVDQDRAANVWISTFHSFCGKVLHQDAQQLDIGNRQEFTVNELTHLYNEVTRAQIEYLQHHQFAEPEDALCFINECRAADVSPAEVESYAQRRHMSQAYVEIYQRYRQLTENDEANYTECQLLTNALFRDVPEVRKRWQEKFELIFVDEYQDTDPIQYQIIKTLTGKHQNLRVVGDDDQGIYGWRGADIQNILNFEENYSNAKVISLGQNYRSTQRIVEISRALAEFNPDRRDKELFTRNPAGEKVRHLHCEDNEKEAMTIAEFISRAIQEGRNPSDFAVLYRTGGQAKIFTEAFEELEIPCHVVVSNSSNRDTDGVSLMTIHKAKGLEFSNVFVAGLCKNLLPHYHNRDEKDWPEELRLLYVAMTRAENWLCLSSYEADAHKRGQSPFLEREYIPPNLLESVETLEDLPIPPNPPRPPNMTVPVGNVETTGYVEPLPISLQTVIGIDPGNIGARTTNVGWSITQKSSQGYSVLDYGTERPTGTSKDKIGQIEQKIKTLIQSSSNRPHAIAVEKLEVATEEARKEWFLYVAACVATVRSIADSEGIECRLYTPQHVKHAATGNREASKEDVQKAVKQMCNLPQIPEPHHSADAIATSLCYLRSYLNSARFEGNKRKQEQYEAGCEYLRKRQYEAAVDTFKQTINIDPIYTEAHYGLGQAYLAQDNLEEAENAAKKSLKLAENNHPDSQKLLNAIEHYRSGCDSLSSSQWNEAIDKFKKSIKLERIFTEAHCGLSRAYFEVSNLDAAKNAAERALELRCEYPPAQKLLDVIICYRYLENERYDEAIEAFTETISKYPDFTEAHCGLGRAYLGKENLTAAEDSANKARKLDPDYRPALELLESITQAYYDRGCDHLDNQRYNEAIAAFKEVIGRDSSFIDAHCQRGRAYLEQGDLDAARESARAARTLDRNHRSARTFWESTRQAHIEHGRAALERGELDIAENIAKAARRFYRSWHPARALLDDIRNQRDYQRGMGSLENEQFDEAIAAFKEVIHRDSNFIDAHCGLSRAYLGQRHLNAARKSANDALRIDENCRHTRELLKNIQLCSHQIDLQETRVDRERRDRGRRRNPRRRESNRNRRRDRGSRRSPRRRESNSGAFQRLWSAIRNRLKHH